LLKNATLLFRNSYPCPTQIRIYSRFFTIPRSAIDENGHVNNVAYVQWMQEIAVEHYESIGGIRSAGPDATWVIREHKIEYLLPAFAGEEIEINLGRIRRVSSLRKYEFVAQVGWARSWSKGKQTGCSSMQRQACRAIPKDVSKSI
jgi:acyl-CoA thioester hydrolase